VMKSKQGQVDTIGGPKNSPRMAKLISGAVNGALADDKLDEADRLIRKGLGVPAPVLPLWAKEKSTLTLLQPVKPDGRAVVICPHAKGGSSSVAPDVFEAGRSLNKQGIAVGVLKPRRGEAEAVNDTQRALSIFRSRAADFGIDPSWIGVM